MAAEVHVLFKTLAMYSFFDEPKHFEALNYDLY
jgi:hypothetical protein